jgi:hypothetical protein
MYHIPAATQQDPEMPTMTPTMVLVELCGYLEFGLGVTGREEVGVFAERILGLFAERVLRLLAERVLEALAEWMFGGGRGVIVAVVVIADESELSPIVVLSTGRGSI